MYEGYVSCSVVVRYLVMPHIGHVYVLLPIARTYVRHVCVLLPLVIPHVRYARLGLNKAVIWKGRTTCIWSFGCGFAWATAMGCVGFRLSFGIIIVLLLLTIIKLRPGTKSLSSSFGSLLDCCLGVRLKLSWVAILKCWDAIAIISTACCYACLFF